MQLFFNISTGAKQRKTFLRRHRKTEPRPLGTFSEVFTAIRLLHESLATSALLLVAIHASLSKLTQPRATNQYCMVWTTPCKQLPTVYLHTN